SIIRRLAGERPVVFPLSNPTINTEALPADILAWTGGGALIATGSPFPGIAQGNNAFIFPGLGLGAVLSGARAVTDGIGLEAARARGAPVGWGAGGGGAPRRPPRAGGGARTPAGLRAGRGLGAGREPGRGARCRRRRRRGRRRGHGPRALLAAAVPADRARMT